MKLQLWRNATLLLTIGNHKILIDPMLGAKGSLGPFPWANDSRPNPLTELPFSDEELQDQLNRLDAIALTHLHPDHWDEAAISRLNKSLPVFCPASIATTVMDCGFENVIALGSTVQWNSITITLTKGRHGDGEIGARMGMVNGFVFKTATGTLYLAGDTIRCPEVQAAIDTHQPDHIVVAGGAATFAIGNPVTMTTKEIVEVAKAAPAATIIVTHLESISPCTEDRSYTLGQLSEAGLSDRCLVPGDSERLVLDMIRA